MEEIRVKEGVVEDVTQQTIKQRWTKLDGLKTATLRRARKCSELTIPSLLPPEGHSEQDQLMTPYQSLGSRGVNNLASKLLLALLPANTPFFKLLIDEFTIEKLSSDENAKTEIQKALGKVERAVMEWIESSKIRVPTFELLKLMICTGNALCYTPDNGGAKVYRLDQYCCKRDPMGNIMEIVIQEKVHPIALPDSIREMVKAAMKDPNEKVEVYTHILRQAEGWQVKQEVNRKNISESETTYKLDDTPWMCLRWTSIANEDYGRGLVEEYLGDLISLEGLMEAMVLGAAAASKVIFLVNPNGSTTVKALKETANGGFAAGKKEDITTLQVEKYADFKVVAELIDRIERRLSYAFLLNSSVQREAERVTAEEIRYIANELEDTLGGVYSILSQEFQFPLIKRLMKQMTKAKKLPQIPKEVKPVITTGLEALGRGHDLRKLDALRDHIVPFGEQTIRTYMKVNSYITRVGTALGVDTEGLIRTDEEVAQQVQQEQANALLQQSAGGVTRELAKGAMNGQTQGQGAEGAGAAG